MHAAKQTLANQGIKCFDRLSNLMLTSTFLGM